MPTLPVQFLLFVLLLTRLQAFPTLSTADIIKSNSTSPSNTHVFEWLVRNRVRQLRETFPNLQYLVVVVKPNVPGSMHPIDFQKISLILYDPDSRQAVFTNNEANPPFGWSDYETSRIAQFHVKPWEWNDGLLTLRDAFTILEAHGIWIEWIKLTMKAQLEVLPLGQAYYIWERGIVDYSWIAMGMSDREIHVGDDPLFGLNSVFGPNGTSSGIDTA